MFPVERPRVASRFGWIVFAIVLAGCGPSDPTCRMALATARVADSLAFDVSTRRGEAITAADLVAVQLDSIGGVSRQLREPFGSLL